MGLLDGKYRELKPTDEYIINKVVLAQAWKKAQQYIRSTNWYANIFELDISTLELTTNLDLWHKELKSQDIKLTPLRLVPAPKSTNWEFEFLPKIPAVGTDILDLVFTPEASVGLNQSWLPVKDSEKKDANRVVTPLRPLAHVPIKEQTYFTALMMCLANKVETIQGDTKTKFEDVHEKRIVNYGNRLYCQYINDEAIFSWGNSNIYSKYFTDYQTFLERSSHFGKHSVNRKIANEQVYEVHLDLSRFYDCIKRTKLTEKVIDFINEADEKASPIIDSLLEKFKGWQWKEGCEDIYKEVCQKENESIPEGIPQGLVAGGFLANIYLLDFDKEMADAIGTIIDEKYQLVDYCRYVDDMRLVIITDKSSTSTSLQQDIDNYIRTKLDELGLALNDKKTKVEVFKTKSSGISQKLKSIQNKVSGPLSNNEIDEQLGHLEGLINLADHIRTSPGASDGNNPLSLIEAPNHDVREDTLVRFSANKIHNLLKQKRSFFSQEVDENNEPIAGSWDYLQERMSRKFIACWSKDPSLVLLVKKGLELYPDTRVLEPVISQLKIVQQRDDEKQKHLAEYCLCEIFRHSATVIHTRNIWAFPAHADLVGYFEHLQLLAIDIVTDQDQYSFNLREQARFYLLVRNDSPLVDESDEDENFNIITKLIKGFRNIANNMSQQQFISNALLAHQLTHDRQQVIRAVCSLLEKINNKGKVRKHAESLGKSDLRVLARVLVIQSSEFFYDLVNYSNQVGMTWQKEVRDIINKAGLYNNAVKGDLDRFKTGVSLLGIIKRNDNPFSHENAVLALISSILENTEFKQPIDLANTKVSCDNWVNIQSLNQEIEVTELSYDDDPLYQVPDWVSESHKPLYYAGMLIRSCLVGHLDWSTSNNFEAKTGRYTGIKSSYVKRQLGLMHSPESINGEAAAMSSWLSSLLFNLLQWPGIKPHDNKENWPQNWDLKALKILVKQRIELQKSMYCNLTGIPGYVEKVSLNWDQSKKDLHVVMVQSLLPQNSDFIQYGMMLDTPQYRAKHRRHVAAVAELILHKVYSQESIYAHQNGKVDLIIWPELAVNIEDTDILKRLSDKTGAMIFTGLNFTTLPGVEGPNNISKWIIPNRAGGNRSFIERFQGKQNMTKDETGHIKPWRPYQLFIELVHPAFELEQGFRLTGSICYDSTDIKLSADLKGKSNAYIISALNQDVSTFDTMINSLYYHMYQHVVLVNSGEFGGSVAKAPYKERYDKLITHVHGKDQVCISSFEMNMFDFRNIGSSYKSNKKIKTEPAGTIL